MPDHRPHLGKPEREDQLEDVLRQVQLPERAHVAVEPPVPPGRAAIAALVGGDDMITGRGERRHDPAPGPRKLRKPVQQQHDGPPRLAGLQQMHAETADPLDSPAAHAAGQRRAEVVR